MLIYEGRSANSDKFFKQTFLIEALNEISHNNIQLFCNLYLIYHFNPSHSNHFSVAMETAKLCMHRGSNFQITNYSVSHDTIHIFIAVFHVIVFDSHAIHPLRRQKE